jgi:hypothetical protein
MALNKGQIKKPVNLVPTPTDLHEGLVSFSFKYLELNHPKFHLPDTAEKSGYLNGLFDRFKQISTMKSQEFRSAGKALRTHQIDWSLTTEPNGYNHLSSQLQGCCPWQFSIAREDLGRVHGFWIGNIFHAVWIDHNHQLFA